jgi:hypothetical protein
MIVTGGGIGRREPAIVPKRVATPEAARRATVPRLVLLLSLLLLSAGARAQKDLSGDPGWVDLRSLGFPSEAATLEIFLEGSLIRMVAETMRAEDARFADLLGKLRAVRVQTFSLEDADEAATVRRSDETVRQLEERGWKPVFRVRDEGERIYLYLKEDAAGVISGVFVMAAELGDSVTVVNIVGDFDPVELGKLGASLQIDPLEMLGRMARGKAGSKPEDEP